MYSIFCDASFRKADATGVIAYMILKDSELPDETGLGQDAIHWQAIRESNNIRCEIRCVLAALEFFQSKIMLGATTLRVYTDCQAIAGLPRRRAQLEQNEFLSRKSGKPLNNADLYQELYRSFDALQPEIHWIKGHSSSKTQDLIQERFRLVDRAARHYLRLLATFPASE